MPYAQSRSSVKVAFCRFRKSRRGSTAIEFAFVAPLFFALLFATMEVGMEFFAGQVLETAIQDSSRSIFTGQFQFQNANLSPLEMQIKFKNEFCSRIVALFDCRGKIAIDVESFPSFSNVVLDNPLDAQNQLRTDFQFQPGNPGDTVVVRVFYEWPMFIKGLGTSLLSGNSVPSSGGTRLLSGTSTFRNEPCCFLN